MKYLLILLTTFICINQSRSQDLTGKWTGVNNPEDSKEQYQMEITLVQKGVQLSGTIKSYNAKDYVIERFTGSVNGNNVLMNEFKVVECTWPTPAWKWNLKHFDGEFAVDQAASQLVVEGVWSSGQGYYRDSTIKEIPRNFGSFRMSRFADIPKKEKPGSTALAAADTVKKAKVFERPLDGYYRKTAILSAHVTPYPNLRDADVVFAKRIWRDIDVRERMNQYLVSPKARLIDVLMAAVDAGELTAYDPTPSKDDPNGDSFAVPLGPGKAKGRFADSSVVDKFDAKGEKIGSTVVAGEFNPDSIVRFRIKEDWIFDKQRSTFEPRIIGIAPLIKLKAAQAAGAVVDYQPAFWIYFPEARNVLAVKEVSNRNNDASGLSFDDVFMKRIFASVIIKESNTKDERIKDYAQGIDRVYESERIKKSLMDWELSLWQY